MRTELQAKFIQYLNQKQHEKGFTLVELLVVIIIIGILAAIALPNFLSQGAKAKQTEAKQNIAVANRVQTVYRSENATFASSFDVLATGTMAGSNTYSSKIYTYTLTAAQDTSTINIATKDSALKIYQGGVVRFVNENNQGVIRSLICEAVNPGSGTGVAPTLTATAKTNTSAIACSSIAYKAL